MVPIDRLSDNWLFERHPKQTLSRWASALNYFYFIRAWGGHANDGDSFKAAFRYTDRQDLIVKLDRLGQTLNAIPPDYPRPVVGKPYTGEEASRFKSEIRKFGDLEQPKWRIVFGHKAFIWVSDDNIEISVMGTLDGDLYEVSEADFETCRALEAWFDELGWQPFADRSVEKTVCCISRTKYPELFH